MGNNAEPGVEGCACGLFSPCVARTRGAVTAALAQSAPADHAVPTHHSKHQPHRLSDQQQYLPSTNTMPCPQWSVWREATTCLSQLAWPGSLNAATPHSLQHSAAVGCRDAPARRGRRRHNQVGDTIVTPPSGSGPPSVVGAAPPSASRPPSVVGAAPPSGSGPPSEVGASPADAGGGHSCPRPPPRTRQTTRRAQTAGHGAGRPCRKNPCPKFRRVAGQGCAHQ